MNLDTRPRGPRPGSEKEPDLSYLRNKEDASVGPAPEWNEESDVDKAEREVAEAAKERLAKQLAGEAKMNERFDRVKAERAAADAITVPKASVEGIPVMDLRQASQRVTSKEDAITVKMEGRAEAIKADQEYTDADTVLDDKQNSATGIGLEKPEGLTLEDVPAWGPAVKTESQEADSVDAPTVEDLSLREVSGWAKEQGPEDAPTLVPAEENASTIVEPKVAPRESITDRLARKTAEQANESRNEEIPVKRLSMEERLERTLADREKTRELQEVKGWSDQDVADVEQAMVNEEFAQTKVQELPKQEAARAAVLELAEGSSDESNEDERQSKQFFEQAKAATKTLMRLNAGRIHDVIRLNTLDGGMVRKADGSLGPADIAERGLGDQIADRMKRDASSARDAALSILGEAFLEASSNLDEMYDFPIDDDLEADMFELLDIIDRESGMNGAAGEYLSTLQTDRTKRIWGDHQAAAK